MLDRLIGKMTVGGESPVIGIGKESDKLFQPEVVGWLEEISRLTKEPPSRQVYEKLANYLVDESRVGVISQNGADLKGNYSEYMFEVRKLIESNPNFLQGFVSVLKEDVSKPDGGRIFTGSNWAETLLEEFTS